MIDDKIYKISVKRHNLNIMLDCTHYLITELLKLEETTIEEAKEFTRLFYEDGDLEKSLNHIITQKMWKLMTYFSYYYSYLLFSKKFVKQEKNKYILYLDNDSENILLKEQKTGYIIKDKQFIKKLLEDDFMNNKLSSTINIRSFYENDRFVLLQSVRDYIIEYFKLDIKIDEYVAIIFKSDDIYTERKKTMELFKNTMENHKKLMKCINKS